MKRIYLVKPTGNDGEKLPYDIERHFSLMGKYIHASLNGDPVYIWYSSFERSATLVVKALLKELPTGTGARDISELNPQVFSVRILAERLNKEKPPKVVIVSAEETERIPVSMGFPVPALMGGDAIVFSKDDCFRIPM